MTWPHFDSNDLFFLLQLMITTQFPKYYLSECQITLYAMFPILIELSNLQDPNSLTVIDLCVSVLLQLIASTP